MQNPERKNIKLFGEPTQASASGIAFSLAAVLPNLLSIIFLIAVGMGDYEQTDWYLYASYLLPQTGFAITAIWFLFYTKTPIKSVVKNQKCAPRYFAIALLLQVGLFFLSELNTLFLSFLENFGYEDAGISLPSMDGFGFIGVLTVVAVLPAILEETIFRGILLGGLKNFGKVGSILLCGALFALYHQNPAQTLYQFCCGVAFALIVVRSGSVLPTVLAHFVNNALILLLTKFGVESFMGVIFSLIFVFSPICLIVSLVWLFVFDKKKDGANEQAPVPTPACDKCDKTERERFFVYASIGLAICALTWIAVLVSGL